MEQNLLNPSSILWWTESSGSFEPMQSMFARYQVQKQLTNKPTILNEGKGEKAAN